VYTKYRYKKERSEAVHYVYIVRCADETLYCGWTTDITGRMQTHNEGRGAKYTRSRRPVTLVYSESFESKSEALKRERAVKKLSRAGKLSLIARGGA
jgi:putative endonuclease